MIEGGVVVAAAAGLAISAILGVGSTQELVEERRAAAAAMDLRMAATAVAHADDVKRLGGDVESGELEMALAMLRSDRDQALHGLASADAARADDLLDQVVEDAASLVDPDARSLGGSDLVELQQLLRSASERSAADAVTAERGAAQALGVMVALLGVVAWLVVRSRTRAARAREHVKARDRAGQRFEVLLNDSPAVLLVVDGDQRISFRSASTDRLLRSEITALEDLVELAGESDRPAFRRHLLGTGSIGVSELFELRAMDGEHAWFDVRVSDLTEHELIGGHLLTIRDVSNEVHLSEELKQQATTDVLTGLPNRRVLQSALDEAHSALENEPTAMALLTLDIDGFKTINDTLGHLAGDEVLVQVAARLDDAVRDGEMLLRLGGDEFAVIVPRNGDAASAERTARRLLSVLDRPFHFGDRTERVRTSIGVAATADPDGVEFLMGRADIALYEAKRLGGDTVVVFEEALESTSVRRNLITRALRSARHDDEFRLVYQPIVAADSLEIVGVEALLRWTSPTLGDVGPDEFIPIAEASGEICTLGRWVFSRVCEQLATWTEAGVGPEISVSFNVSPRQLAEESFVPGVLEIAASRGVDPAQLVVEVTETVALDHTGRAQQRLEQLRQAGFRVSIDDFGSGYSNLGQLLAVPLDTIKIDRSLLLMLSDMRLASGDDPTGPCAIMSAIVSIAAILDASVVSEGVETEEQLTSLRASGITHIQGYLTGRPAPPEVITEALAMGDRAVLAGGSA